jgi:hypothetical protein
MGARSADALERRPRMPTNDTMLCCIFLRHCWARRGAFNAAACRRSRLFRGLWQGHRGDGVIPLKPPTSTKPSGFSPAWHLECQALGAAPRTLRITRSVPRAPHRARSARGRRSRSVAARSRHRRHARIEEANRLEPVARDLQSARSFRMRFGKWEGYGVAVQAYQSAHTLRDDEASDSRAGSGRRMSAARESWWRLSPGTAAGEARGRCQGQLPELFSVFHASECCKIHDLFISRMLGAQLIAAPRRSIRNCDAQRAHRGDPFLERRQPGQALRVPAFCTGINGAGNLYRRRGRPWVHDAVYTPRWAATRTCLPYLVRA